MVKAMITTRTMITIYMMMRGKEVIYLKKRFNKIPLQLQELETKEKVASPTKFTILENSIYHPIPWPQIVHRVVSSDCNSKNHKHHLISIQPK